jgi:hypothetical protein
VRRYYRAHRTAVQTAVAVLAAAAFVLWYLADQLG